MKVSPLPLLAVLTLLAPPAFAASELGKVDFPNSGSPAAQAPFLRGIAALHSFWYDEAADAFREAQKADPGFALAYWGEALTYDHPIWGEQDRDAALAVLARLAPTREARAAKAPTEREKGFLEAVEILYGEGEKPARNAAYAEALRKLHERFPEDLEIATFYSLSLIGPALTGPAGAERDRPLIRAAAILEELFDRNREHPGVLHYMIHAYDDPLHAPLGLRAARLYAKTAPAAHHALHMPSHIFVQIGDWPAAVASNEEAWAASVAWVERRRLSPDKRDFHSLSWLLYAYLQQGRLGKARDTLEVARQARESDAPRVVNSLKDMEARYLVETGGWRKNLAQAAEMEGGGHHCHGGGAMPADQGGKILEKQVSALALLAKEDSEGALKLLAEAAEDEARMPPPMGPPDPAKPAHELYGEVLLELGRAEEAGRQFDLALLRTPNRTASLLGAARAAAKRGDAQAARAHYGKLAEIWRQADPDVPELAEVRSYLGSPREGRPASP
jgi:tetratricopeptide (TPR) repeat protein